MRAMLLAAAAFVMVASPTFAQSHDSEVGAARAVRAHHHAGLNAHRAVRQVTPYEAYGQSPAPLGGYRWPGAHYDANGYYIDPNSPGRW